MRNDDAGNSKDGNARERKGVSVNKMIYDQLLPRRAERPGTSRLSSSALVMREPRR